MVHYCKAVIYLVLSCTVVCASVLLIVVIWIVLLQNSMCYSYVVCLCGPPISTPIFKPLWPALDAIIFFAIFRLADRTKRTGPSQTTDSSTARCSPGSTPPSPTGEWAVPLMRACLQCAFSQLSWQCTEGVLEVHFALIRLTTKFKLTTMWTLYRQLQTYTLAHDFELKRHKGNAKNVWPYHRTLFPRIFAITSENSPLNWFH